MAFSFWVVKWSNSVSRRDTDGSLSGVDRYFAPGSARLAQGGGFAAFWLERGGVHVLTLPKGGMTAE